jgi:hypothetical protein
MKLMTLITSVLNKTIEGIHVYNIAAWNANGLPQHKRNTSISQHPENRHSIGVRNPFYERKTM